jgi:toxin secretion/phage lysis holin
LNLSKLFDAMLAGVGGFIGWCIGGFDTALLVLVVMVLLDYSTGFMAAWKNQRLDSTVGFTGIMKKVMIFVVVVVATLGDMIIGQSNVLRMACIVMYIGNEGLSILENAGEVGLWVPEPLKRAIRVLRGDKGEEQALPRPEPEEE